MEDGFKCCICLEPANLVEPYAGGDDQYKIECSALCGHYYVVRTVWQSGKFVNECKSLTQEERGKISGLVKGKVFHTANLEWLHDPASDTE
jgi:hypothetical protein